VRKSRAKTRSTILEAAYRLFRQKGFARVNIDEIAAAAKLTKRTLYDNFESKDKLLEEVLTQQHELAYAAFQSFGKKLLGKPEAIIETYFGELERWSASPRWSGSGYTRLVIELADLPGHPARKLGRKHKALLESHLAEVLKAAGASAPRERARQIWLLTEGAMVLMLVHGDKDYFRAATKAAKVLLASNLDD
jgi:AcrR family transcriptional regulator